MFSNLFINPEECLLINYSYSIHTNLEKEEEQMEKQEEE